VKLGFSVCANLDLPIPNNQSINYAPHPPKNPIPKNQPPQFSGKIQSQFALTRKTPRKNA
jgi:hypothetical protein